MGKIKCALVHWVKVMCPLYRVGGSSPFRVLTYRITTNAGVFVGFHVLYESSVLCVLLLSYMGCADVCT